jgi:5-methylthioadenosine/S-adenosylhomocysteine deaminase
MSEILIQGPAVITMEGSGVIYEDGEIAVSGDSIVSAGPRGSAPEGFVAQKVIDGSGMVALPGLVNCHTHAAMTLLRGYADDLPLMQWLNEKIWPVEGRLQPEDVYWGTLLCCLEMIKSGTTAFADMYFEMDQVARAVEQSGMRASLARGMVGAGPDAQKAIDESLSLVREWNGAAGGRIKVMFGPHAPYTCPPEYLRQVTGLAADHKVGIHIHVAETRDELEQIYANYHMSPVKHLQATGLFEVPVLAAHCVYVDEEDIEVLAAEKVRVAHCPESNMKLASGISPVTGLLKAGVQVGLGTDGAASNNNLDLLEEMRTAALLQKVNSGDPVVLPAYEALQMATCKGAQVLGLSEVGQLKAGMKADVILVNYRCPHHCPRHDLVANLVYAAHSADVETVIINGTVVMEDRRVLTMDEEKIMTAARQCALQLVGKK